MNPRFSLETRLALRLVESFPNRVRMGELNKVADGDNESAKSALSRLTENKVIEWIPSGYSLTNIGMVTLIKTLLGENKVLWKELRQLKADVGAD